MAVQLEKVSKSYGDKAVLSGLSLTLPDQGVVALMGPSGCGKTTLLRLLAGLEQPQEGCIRFEGPMRLSMVFQEDRLLPALTARDNILAALEQEQAELADLWLERLGLMPAAGLSPGEMSGGMRRRLAIARAMAYGGDLLLLDEPFQGLDKTTREQVTAAVFQSGQGRLIVLVTHDRAEAERWADRIIDLGG